MYDIAFQNRDFMEESRAFRLNGIFVLTLYCE